MKIIGSMNNNNSQIRSFADIARSKTLSDKIMKSSRSATDMDVRVKAYSQAYENLLRASSLAERLRTKKHSATGTGLADLSGISPNQFIDVTVTAMIKSIAGFLTVERGVDQPTAVLTFIDSVQARGKKTDPDYMIAPNIGPDVDMKNGYADPKDVRALKSAKIKHKKEFSTTEAGASINTAKAVVPRTLKVTVVRGGKNFILTDDGNGNLIGPASAKLDDGTIDYSTGTIEWTFATGSEFNAGDSFLLEVNQDTPKDPTNRMKGELDNYIINCVPELIIAEHNLVTNLVAEKSMHVSMQDIMKKKVMDEYLKIVNRSVIDPIVLGYEGNVMNVDLSAYSISTNNFESYLQLFTHNLNRIDSALTKKSFRSIHTSAYLVGERVADLFKNMTRMGSFVLNTSASYIEDLVGHYNGIPVVKSHYVEPDTGYAIHKTSDGMLAPVCRAIFLPVNDLPQIGNFNNPTQFADGIYSYEGTGLLTNDLVQKFTVKHPTGLGF